MLINGFVLMIWPGMWEKVIYLAETITPIHRWIGYIKGGQRYFINLRVFHKFQHNIIILII